MVDHCLDLRGLATWPHRSELEASLHWAASAIALLSTFVLASGYGAEVNSDIPRCTAPFDKLVANDIFNRYRTPIRAGGIKPVAPDVKSGRAHLYRTVIRAGAKRGPNFAGHYTIIDIGCGAATVCPVIVNAKTGRVFFPPEIEQAEALLVDTGDLGVETLNYKRDSRVIIIIGTRNENSKKARA